MQFDPSQLDPKLRRTLEAIRKGSPATALGTKQVTEALTFLGVKLEPVLVRVPMSTKTGATNRSGDRLDNIWLRDVGDKVRVQAWLNSFKTIHDVAAVGDYIAEGATGPTFLHDEVWEASIEQGWRVAPGVRLTLPNGWVTEAFGYVRISRPIASVDVPRKPEGSTIALISSKDVAARAEIVRLASAALGLPTPEEEKRRKSRERTDDNVGTCSVCQRQQKLEQLNTNGTQHGGLVLHGYQRPGVGWIVGSCPGVGYPPLEASPEGLVAFLPFLGRQTLRQIQETREVITQVVHVLDLQPPYRGINPIPAWLDKLKAAGVPVRVVEGRSATSYQTQITYTPQGLSAGDKGILAAIREIQRDTFNERPWAKVEKAEHDRRLFMAHSIIEQFAELAHAVLTWSWKATLPAGESTSDWYPLESAIAGHAPWNSPDSRMDLQIFQKAQAIIDRVRIPNGLVQRLAERFPSDWPPKGPPGIPMALALPTTWVLPTEPPRPEPPTAPSTPGSTMSTPTTLPVPAERVRTSSELRAVADRLVRLIRSHGIPVNAVYLVGSYLAGEPGHDVDLWVQTAQEIDAPKAAALRRGLSVGAVTVEGLPIDVKFSTQLPSAIPRWTVVDFPGDDALSWRTLMGDEPPTGWTMDESFGSGGTLSRMGWSRNQSDSDWDLMTFDAGYQPKLTGGPKESGYTVTLHASRGPKSERIWQYWHKTRKGVLAVARRVARQITKTEVLDLPSDILEFSGTGRSLGAETLLRLPISTLLTLTIDSADKNPRVFVRMPGPYDLTNRLSTDTHIWKLIGHPDNMTVASNDFGEVLVQVPDVNSPGARLKRSLVEYHALQAEIPTAVKKHAHRTRRPDGTIDPQVWDEVYTSGRGFGGGSVQVHGTVTSTLKGTLQVTIAPASRSLVEKDQLPLDNLWGLVDDPTILEWRRQKMATRIEADLRSIEQMLIDDYFTLPEEKVESAPEADLPGWTQPQRGLSPDQWVDALTQRVLVIHPEIDPLAARMVVRTLIAELQLQPPPTA